MGKKEAQHYEGLDILLYMIYSTRTGMPFLSETREIVLFDNAQEADDFLDKNKDTRRDEGIIYDMKSLQERGAACGALRAVIRHSGKTTSYAVHPVPKHERYTNPEVTARLALMLETRKKKYLKELGTAHFIAATQINKDEKTGYPVIRYGAAFASARNKSDFLYLLFSDLDAFNEWCSDEPWEPLEIEFWQVAEFFHGKGVMINPGSSDLLVITTEQLQEVPYTLPEMGNVVIPKEMLGR